MVLAIVISLAVGFGLGRIKNAGKLKQVSAELAFLEQTGVATSAKVIAAIRSKL